MTTPCEESAMVDQMIAIASEKVPFLRDDLVDEALRLIHADVHPAGTRPCETCRKVTAIIHGPFWCLRKALGERHEAGLPPLSD